MKLFLDTEFTDFTNSELISIGIVDERGRDTWCRYISCNTMVMLGMDEGRLQISDKYLMRIKDILSESVVSPKIGYHVTSDKNLSTILKHGFKPDKRGQTYFWGDRDMAEWFSDYQNDNNEPRTILRVNLSGVNLVPDSEAEDMSEWSSRFEPGTPGNAWITTDQISPDRIIQ